MSTDQETLPRSRFLPAIGLAVLNSLVQLGGVAFLGWPVGNIFLLLWAENVIITLVAITRMIGVRGAPDEGTLQKTSTAFGLLFFCLVHGVFSFVLAIVTGLNLTVAMFLMPLVLLVVRYAVETMGWYTHAARPATLSQAYGFAMRRIVMLHLAIIACWGVMIFTLVATFGSARAQSLPTLQLVLLGILLVIKTITEIHAIRLGPNAPTSWKFTAGRR